MTHPNEEPDYSRRAKKRAEFQGFAVIYTEYYDTTGSVTLREINNVLVRELVQASMLVDSLLRHMNATWDELIDAAPTTTTLS